MRLCQSLLCVAGLGLCGTPASAVKNIPCTEFPYVKLEELIHNNLGGHGPSFGDEGMFFRVSLKNVGLSQTTAQLRVHAYGRYTPYQSNLNQLYGAWGHINVSPGTDVTLTANFWDPVSKKNLTLPRGYMTFSDIDAALQPEREFVTVSNFFYNYYIGDLATMTVDPHILTTTFWGKETSLVTDFPLQEDMFTLQQKRKAITLQTGPAGLQAVIFKFGCTPGRYMRLIQFNFQATMLCAQTWLPNGRLVAATETSGGNAFPRANGEEPVTETDFNKLKICRGYGCYKAAY